MPEMRVSFDDVRVELPDDVRVGDQIRVRGLARVKELAEDEIDAAGYGDAFPTSLPGELTARLRLVEVLVGEPYLS